MLMVHSYIKGVLFYLITLYTYYDSDYNNHFVMLSQNIYR